MLEVKLFCAQLELYTIWKTKKLNAIMVMMEKDLAVLQRHMDKPAGEEMLPF